jgi:hypothetical protein
MVIARKLFQRESKRFSVGKIFRGAHAMNMYFTKNMALLQEKNATP